MKKRTGEEMNKGKQSKESTETAADNALIDNTDTSQADELRAYVPAGAAMAFAEPEEEEPYYEEDYREEDEDEYDDDDSAVNEIARDMDQESASELLFRYAEQDRLDQESEESDAYEEEPEGDLDPTITEDDESPVQSDVDMKLVEDTVDKINSLHRKDVDNGKLKIGEYLLDTIFGGDMGNASSHNPMKSATFAKIAESPKLEVDARTLGSWVRAAHLRRKLTDKGLQLSHLSTYHYVELASVKDEQRQVVLAKKAHAEQLSVKALRDQIRAMRQKSPSEAEKNRAELDKRIRYSLEFPQANGLKEFSADLDLVREQYPGDKAYTKLKVVKKCLVNLRTHEEIFTQFLSNLQAVVDEDLNDATD